MPLKDKNQVFNTKLGEHRQQEEERLLFFMSQKYGYPVLKFTDIKVDANAVQLVKEVDAREAKMAIYKNLRGTLEILINEPANNKQKEILRELEGRGFGYKLFFSPIDSLEKVWETYKDIISTSATIPGTISIDNNVLEEEIEKIDSVEQAKELLDKFKELPPARKLSKGIEYVSVYCNLIRCFGYSHRTFKRRGICSV